MKKQYLLAAFLFVLIADAQAGMNHSRHGGRAGMGGTPCVRPQLTNMQPAQMEPVKPGSEFSFILSNIDDPSDISVEVKRQPVEIVAEFKDPNYVVKGKIPSALKGTAARVDVRVNSKIASCRAEDGWLLKISE